MGKKIDKELLFKLYISEAKTAKEISQILGISQTSVANYAKKYGFVRTPEEARTLAAKFNTIKIDPKQLFQIYMVENKTVRQIAKIFNTSIDTVSANIAKHGFIKSREQVLISKNDMLDIDREKMHRLYIVDNKSAKDVAKILNVGITSVLRYAKKYNLTKDPETIQASKSNSLKIDEGLLYQLYMAENKTAGEVAKILNIKLKAVRRYISKCNFVKAPAVRRESAKKSSIEQKRKTVFIDKDILYKIYILDNNSAEEVGRILNLGVSIVTKYIKIYGFSKTPEKKKEAKEVERSKAKQTRIKNGNQVEVNGLSVREISKKFNVSVNLLSRHLRTEKPTDEQFMGFVQNFVDKEMNELEYKFSQIPGVTRFNKKPGPLLLNRKPDFQVNPRIFIDVDGIYWHSECIQKDKWYHFKKRLAFEQGGLRLLQFREDEINFKFHIVESMVGNIRGKSIKIYARKTVIKEVNQKEATLFLNNNHIMGNSSSRHVGLFYENQLVCLFSYKIYKDKLDVTRFCSLINHTIVGGFSRLLKYVEKLHPNLPVHYWVDLRYGTGNFLLSLGFEKDHDELSWKWTDFKHTHNRRQCRANMDERRLTEREHANELKLYKIYDAGQRLYVKKAN